MYTQSQEVSSQNLKLVDVKGIGGETGEQLQGFLTNLIGTLFTHEKVLGEHVSHFRRGFAIQPAPEDTSRENLRHFYATLNGVAYALLTIKLVPASS